MTGRASLVALVAVILVAATGAAADVLELRNGQRVEGKLQQATPAFVAIEVSGRIVTYPTDQVLAIRFGTPPAVAAGSPAPDAAPPARRAPGPTVAPPPGGVSRSPEARSEARETRSEARETRSEARETRSEAREALAALQGFRDFLAEGVTYKEYAARLAEVRKKVEHVPRGGLAPAGNAAPLENALRYYTSARVAWERSLQSPTGQMDDASMAALANEACSALRSLASRERGTVLSAAWICASDALDEAARTVR